MNKTLFVIIIFGALSFGLLFFVFYSELTETQQIVTIQKKETETKYQQEQGPLNNVDVEILNSDLENAKVIYSKPYSLKWKQDGAEIMIKGIYHGVIEAPRGIARDDGKGQYVGGEKIHALLFNLQIISGEDVSSKCVKIPSKLIDINDQTVKSANTHQFHFPGTGGCGMEPNRIYEDQQIIFVVQPSSTQFALLPTGDTNRIFHVMVQGKFMQFEEATSLESVGVFDSGLLRMFAPKEKKVIIDKDAAPYLKITNPTVPVRIPRGDTVNVEWDAYNVDASSKIIIRLKSENLDYVPSKVYRVSDRRGGIAGTMPSGEYTLEVQHDGEVIYSGEVEIIGGNEIVSKRQSEFSFVDRDEISELGTKGENTAQILARLIDNYSYPIVGKRVRLISSRKDDKIAATSRLTNKNGEVQFIITSEKEGISKLFLEVDGQRWEQTLLLNVIEREKECGCDDCDCEECLEEEEENEE